MRVESVLAVAVIMAIASDAFAATRIGNDMGGRIGNYVDQFSALRNSGEQVVLDGRCLSACTLVVGIVPRNRICVTPRAELGFHAAWVPGPNGQPVPSAAGTQALWAMYPLHVRQWIRARGGLSAKMMFLRGRELQAMYPQCRDGTRTLQAQSPRQPATATVSATPASVAAPRAQKKPVETIQP
jgi:hypothetical protein